MVLEPDEPTPEGYSDVLERLSAEGIHARFTCLMVPVQLEGHLPSGDSFYFRCRYTTCSLGIAPADEDPVSEPIWRHEVTRWEGFDAGCLDPEEAETVFRELLAAYATHRP